MHPASLVFGAGKELIERLPEAKRAVAHGKIGRDLKATTLDVDQQLAPVRHRTVRTKGSLSSKTARLMVFKLVMAAARTWRRLKGQNQLPKLIAGARFLDGIEVIETKPQSAA